MALFEFHCDRCNHRFERLTQVSEKGTSDYGLCPKCGRNDRSTKLISRFRIGGQGDLRESTVHGCHEFDGVSDGDSGHSHDPSHNHDSGDGHSSE